jgi:hypothetical protein
MYSQRDIKQKPSLEIKSKRGNGSNPRIGIENYSDEEHNVENQNFQMD